MQYSTTYPTLGAIGGEATHVLTDNEIPPVSVPYTGSNADNGDSGALIITAATQSNGAKNLTTSGGGQAHNNMQPYMVMLFVKKL
jgi:microcystin-dependent protein